MCLEVLKYDPKNIKALFKSAEFEFELGRVADAQKHLSQCEADLSDEPKFVELQKKLSDANSDAKPGDQSYRPQTTDHMPEVEKNPKTASTETTQLAGTADSEQMSPSKLPTETLTPNKREDWMSPVQDTVVGNQRVIQDQQHHDALRTAESEDLTDQKHQQESTPAQINSQADRQPSDTPNESSTQTADQMTCQPQKNEEPPQSETRPQAPNSSDYQQPQPQETVNNKEPTTANQDPKRDQTTPDIDEKQLKENLQKGPIYWLFLFLNYWQLLVGILIGYCLAKIV